MKKQTNLPANGRKLSLSKRTISNLNSSEMDHLIGGKSGHTCHGCYGGGGNSKNCTNDGANTCPGHNTCYTC